MVAIALDPASRPQRHPALRLVPPTAGRRPVPLLLGAVAAVVVALAIAFLVLSPPLAEPGTIPAADGGYQVQTGDTMWSIAQDRAPAGEAATYVERMVELNGSATVEAGQLLQLPRS